MKKTFKGGSGVWLTSSLFWEKRKEDLLDTCYFTLQDEDRVEDGKTYVSLYRLYMEERDIHEVAFAKKHLGGYKHWKTMCSQEWFKPMIMEWREELELTLMSEGFASLTNILAASDPKNALQAARYFADRGWDTGIGKAPTSGRKAGRPTNQTMKDRLVDSFPSDVKDDYARLMGVKN